MAEYLLGLAADASATDVLQRVEHDHEQMVGDIGSSLPALAAAAVVLDDATVLASRDDVSALKLSTAGAILAEMAASTTTAIVPTT